MIPSFGFSAWVTKKKISGLNEIKNSIFYETFLINFLMSLLLFPRFNVTQLNEFAKYYGIIEQKRCKCAKRNGNLTGFSGALKEMKNYLENISNYRIWGRSTWPHFRSASFSSLFASFEFQIFFCSSSHSLSQWKMFFRNKFAKKNLKGQNTSIGVLRKV